MAATPHDPHNLREIDRVVALGVRIQHRKARGKPVKQLESRVDAIRKQAQQREAARRKRTA